ncbi:hypothetical protein ABBQ32_010804 [Trebouxia sp. C0010 RCD-2024]
MSIVHTNSNPLTASVEVTRRVMHPPLHIHKHPHCKKLIEDLQACHCDHPVAKFWGHCNDQKIALDACFRQEKKLNSAINRQKAKAFKDKLLRSREANQVQQAGATEA